MSLVHYNIGGGMRQHLFCGFYANLVHFFFPFSHSLYILPQKKL